MTILLYVTWHILATEKLEVTFLLDLFPLTMLSYFKCCFPLQRDTTGLSNENTGLHLRLQAMEQQAQMRDGK